MEPEITPREELGRLAEAAQRAWEDRTLLTDRSGPPLDLDLEDRIHGDLLDLAVLWADLRMRRLAGGPAEAEAERLATLVVLKEAEALCGASPVLTRACQELAREEVGGAPSSPRTAWEHCAVGRTLLGGGRLEEAAAAFTAALTLQPGDFWSNFYQGVCWYRLGRNDEALRSFAICVALAPTSAECFHNRALAYAALGRRDRALQDYDRALKLNPNLSETSLNRGLLHYQAEHHALRPRRTWSTPSSAVPTLPRPNSHWPWSVPPRAIGRRPCATWMKSSAASRGTKRLANWLRRCGTTPAATPLGHTKTISTTKYTKYTKKDKAEKRQRQDHGRRTRSRGDYSPGMEDPHKPDAPARAVPRWRVGLVNLFRARVIDSHS